MFQKALMFFFAAKVALVTCHYETGHAGLEKQKMKVERTGTLDRVLDECSGICPSPWSEHLLALNDSGGKAELYEISKDGKLVNTHPVPGAVNRDWEEITTDPAGNVYIGDFGNNSNRRKDLTIYKYSRDTSTGGAPGNSVTPKITFRYAGQTFATDEKKEFDCEAFFWANDSLYLFSKSWEKGAKICRMYVLPDRPGDYELTPHDEIFFKAQITGAAINAGKDRFALISYGKIFLFGISNGRIGFHSPIACIKIARKQTEAILFEDTGGLLFTNEQRGMFRIKLKDKS
ncbi:hypothetical protein [Leadbetterella sp. DM7]|uniref:hypothetical protein n=1 Tax=Leadbetterella sp. DM7 TaxID=3235085 RepID=UPI00349E7F94